MEEKLNDAKHLVQCSFEEHSHTVTQNSSQHGSAAVVMCAFPRGDENSKPPAVGKRCRGHVFIPTG